MEETVLKFIRLIIDNLSICLYDNYIWLRCFSSHAHAHTSTHTWTNTHMNTHTGMHTHASSYDTEFTNVESRHMGTHCYVLKNICMHLKIYILIKAYIKIITTV